MTAAKDIHSVYVIFEFISWTFWLMVSLIINRWRQFHPWARLILHSVLISVKKGYPSCKQLAESVLQHVFHKSDPLSCICMSCMFCVLLCVFTESTGCKLLVHPFPCCILPNFLSSEPGGFLEKLKCELLRLKFHEKSNDLYQFHQVTTVLAW